MLINLHIKNFAIIEEVDLTFRKALHVITGETGAGKSIMLDALGLALGERQKGGSPGLGSEKTVVEASFDVSKLNLKTLFEEEGIDYFDTLILRREILPQGRSRAFVNDTPSTLNFLQKLAAHLIEVHQQFDQLALRESSFQYDVLDVLAKQKTEVASFRKAYKDWSKSKTHLEELRQAAVENAKELDYLQFQLDELLAFDIQEDDDELSDRQTWLSQAEEVQSAVQQVDLLLGNENGSAIENIRQSIQLLSGFNQNVKLTEWVKQAESILDELNDLHLNLSDLVDPESHDPQALAEVEERLSILFRLKKKHQVDSAEELKEIQDRLESRLERISNSDDEIQKLEEQIVKAERSLLKSAKSISSKRSKAIPAFESNVQASLKGLGMPDALLQVALSQDVLSENGIDKIEFLFSSNKGVPPTPIKLTASGGEISRLNLAIKSEVAGEMALPTIIFDEIDSGVSGDVARKIAALLEKLSSKHQIICITHTPQIASSEAMHFHVYKDSSGQTSKTRVMELTQAQRIDKIGEMLDGAPPGKEALKNAKALLKK